MVHAVEQVWDMVQEVLVRQGLVLGARFVGFLDLLKDWGPVRLLAAP
jgi:hypothetical protein